MSDQTLTAVATAYLSQADAPDHGNRVENVKALLQIAGYDKVDEIPPQHRLAAMRIIQALHTSAETLSALAATDGSVEGFDTVDGYGPLAAVLRDAYDQSAKGKGKERHANGKPFLMQPIMSIGRMVGPGYPLGQAMKKAQEAGGMCSRGNVQAAKAELLGVIVYTAAAIILMEEQEKRS